MVNGTRSRAISPGRPRCRPNERRRLPAHGPGAVRARTAPLTGAGVSHPRASGRQSADDLTSARALLYFSAVTTKFHPLLTWPERLETALRLGWVWAMVPRLVAPPVPAGVAAGPGPELRLLGIGDSIIAGIGVEAQSQSLVAQVAARLAGAGRAVRWESAGVSGATAAMLDGLLEARGGPPPDLLLLSCGVNDVVRGRSAAELSASLAGFYRKAQARWPEVRIVHAGIPPLESFPALHGPLGRLLGKHGMSCIQTARHATIAAGAVYADFPRDVDAARFARDGFHPNAAGCAAWAVAVARTIEESGVLRVTDARAALA